MADAKHQGFSRRRLLRGAGVAGVGIAGAGAGLGIGAATAGAAAPALVGPQTEPFHGIHQSGVATTPQTHAQFVGLDLAAGIREPSIVDGLMRIWSQDAASLMAGKPALADVDDEIAASPARLTVTLGIGPTLFDRVGLASRRPSWLHPLPAFGIDRLDDAWGQTDIMMQVCADDPITVAHAVRALTASVRGRTRIRWSQRGFRSSPTTHAAGTTMRNLMGNVDGTVNLRSDDEFERYVWCDRSDQDWMAGGTSMVLRRIAINLDTWEELDRDGRELSVGRRIDSGAPLTGDREFDTPDFGASEAGIPVIPQGSHIARAHQRHPEEQFLRRAYNYDDAPGPGQTSNSGLLFAAYQRDIDKQFLPVQRRLDEHDALNQWTTPIGSAVYAIPPGATEGRHLGAGLFDT